MYSVSDTRREKKGPFSSSKQTKIKKKQKNLKIQTPVENYCSSNARVNRTAKSCTIVRKSFPRYASMGFKKRNQIWQVEYSRQGRYSTERLNGRSKPWHISPHPGVIRLDHY